MTSNLSDQNLFDFKQNLNSSLPWQKDRPLGRTAKIADRVIQYK